MSTKLIFAKSYLFILLVLISSNSFSQTQTIINYETWTGASGCNIFSAVTNVPATLNGSNINVAHFTAIGQPAYSSANHSVNLDSRIENGINQGTEYRMTVNFKLGHSYQITVTAARIMSTPTGPNVLLRLDLNNGEVQATLYVTALVLLMQMVLAI